MKYMLGHVIAFDSSGTKLDCCLARQRPVLSGQRQPEEEKSYACSDPKNWPIGVLTADTMYTGGRGGGAMAVGMGDGSEDKS